MICTVRPGRVVKEIVRTSGEMSTESSESAELRMDNEAEIKEWIAEAAAGEVVSGRYIPARRFDPTVSYSATTEDGRYVSLSYSSPTYWDKNFSETARVMLQATLDKICDADPR